MMSTPAARCSAWSRSILRFFSTSFSALASSTFFTLRFFLARMRLRSDFVSSPSSATCPAALPRTPPRPSPPLNTSCGALSCALLCGFAPTSSIATAGRSGRTSMSSTNGLGVKWKCDIASSLPHSFLKSSRACFWRGVSSFSSASAPPPSFARSLARSASSALAASSSSTSPRPFVLLVSSSSMRSFDLLGFSSSGGGSGSSKSLFRMRCMIMSSISFVFSAVFSGAGMDTRSNSISRSSALCFGRWPDITSPW
mmetsp:Transcript_4316/g.15106  ORF Transcript_4316/g.15106 Transcript_4316/m.15106 type:complete len:255 (+) Transcript_4316:753-1517(+)